MALGASETSGTETLDFQTPAIQARDIRPEDAMVGQRVAMADDVAWLEARSAGFEPADCPACGEDNAMRLYEKYGMQHVRCSYCATQYVNPRPTAVMLREFYAQSSNYAFWAREIFPRTAEVRRNALFKPRAELVAAIARDNGIVGGTIVEVGAGYGLFCEEVKRTGLFSDVVGIEPTPDLAEICRSKGISTFADSYENASLSSPANVIVAFEVIEHLHEPRKFMSWCHDNLRMGGFVYMSCPNSAGFETLALGRQSDTVDHEHLNLFTPRGLHRLSERCGFSGVVIETPGQLDTDIVSQAYKSGTVNASYLGHFLTYMMDQCEEQLGAFQRFLQSAKLSSNMTMLAFKR
jgi:2-polyprenyl-3-methyl-5-hydroxy-6-metoxy-1,4-benzoquinol methylase